MEKVTIWINKILTFILVFLMAAMVLDVSWQVFTRFVLKAPSPFTEELAGFLLIWIGLLGASYALHTRAHLGIDVLTYKLEGLKKQVVEILIYTIVMLFALFVMVIGGIRLVNLAFTLKQVSPSLGINIGYVYLVIPVSGILFIYYSVEFIVNALKQRLADIESHKVSMVD